MDNKTLSDLIGLIYDVAFDASLWPRLMDALAHELAPMLMAVSEPGGIDADAGAVHENQNDPDAPLVPVPAESGNCSGMVQSGAYQDNQLANNALLNGLRTHFTRALQLHQRIFEAQEETAELQDLFERLPLGMLIVDRTSRILTYNRKLNEILTEGKGISIINNVLCAESSPDTKSLHQAVCAVADSGNQNGEILYLCHTDMPIPLSVLVLPFNPKSASNGKSQNKVVVLVAAPGMKMEISPEILMSVYQLTKAEARLVAALVYGGDLNSITKDFGVSKHTIRNQLKAVYEKTGTHRQSELVRQVMTGPATLATIYSKSGQDTRKRRLSNAWGNAAKSGALLNQTLRLPDGRQLGYAEYGCKTGRPVMHMHAYFGSRLERHPDETIIKRCGIRLIVPDRPGVGLSDPRDDLTLFNWADDVAYLADYLDLKKFNVIGHSIGAAFGLACAHRLGKRIERIIIVCGVAPYGSVWELEGMSVHIRLLLALVRHANALMEPLMRFMGARVPTEDYLKDLWRTLPPVDQALLCDPAIRNGLMENIRENSSWRKYHFLQEILLISGQWGFDPTRIDMPVEMWHGAQDRIVPPGLANKMAEGFSNCRTHFLPGAGHYLLFHCWKEILLASIGEDREQAKLPYRFCESRVSR